MITRLLGVCLAAAALASGAPPLALHPANPHYFLFRGKPTVLVTSGEHYGSLINLDFNYVRYLSTLHSADLNLSRVFVGGYRELPGSFNIAGNVLAPKPESYIAPWPVVQDKYDLSRWNEAYFARLKDLVRQAAKRGVVLELNLFCPYYEDNLWDVSPFNARNNINGVGNLKRTEVLTLQNGGLLAIQDALVKRIVSEVREFDNVYFEICNEPYFGGVTLEWQRHIAGVIAEAEAGLPARHLISQNIANGSVKIENPDERVGLFNFHYSRPPGSVGLNYALGKAIGNNETGFDGTGDAIYRIQGWDFLLAGGALYNNLDYTFNPGHEDGSFVVAAGQPGWGSAGLRRQLGILLRFMESLDFVHMKPAPEVLKSIEPSAASVRVLAGPREWAAYLHHGKVVKDAPYSVDATPQNARIALELPAGKYEAEWTNTRTGQVDKRERVEHPGGSLALSSPTYTEDIALRVKAR